jgi:site-specific DNA-methyltransferase (adenine-specific)
LENKIETKFFCIEKIIDLNEIKNLSNGIFLFFLPLTTIDKSANLFTSILKFLDSIPELSTIIIFGSHKSLPFIHESLSDKLYYQSYFSIKSFSENFENISRDRLPTGHISCMLYTKYKGSLKHTLTRIKYTYCPLCKKTTKDYGGKKHTYHHYGTLISDVWRDEVID